MQASKAQHLADAQDELCDFPDNDNS